MSPDKSSPMFVTATLPDKPVNVSAAICFSFRDFRNVRNDCPAREACRWESHAQIRAPDCFVLCEFADRAAETDLPFFEDIRAVADQLGAVQVLFGRQNRPPFALQF